jgi:hypothetical protein
MNSSRGVPMFVSFCGAAIVISSTLIAGAVIAQQTAPASSPGRALFETRCASCH